MDQALAIIDLENAINLLLPEISPCISKTRFAKVCKYKEECLYIEALEYITAYIEPFVDHLDTSTLALLLESWTFACKYRRLCVEKEERRYEKYCTDGQETYFAKAVIEALEFKRACLKLCETGEKKATIYLERRLHVRSGLSVAFHQVSPTKSG